MTFLPGCGILHSMPLNDVLSALPIISIVGYGLEILCALRAMLLALLQPRPFNPRGFLVYGLSAAAMVLAGFFIYGILAHLDAFRVCWVGAMACLTTLLAAYFVIPYQSDWKGPVPAGQR